MKNRIIGSMIVFILLIVVIIYANNTSQKDLVELNHLDVTSSQSETEVVALQDTEETKDIDLSSAKAVIHIDKTGYQYNEIKTVYFEKGNPDDDFFVVNVDTRETVLSGKIDAKRKGDFSTLTKIGRYYIEVPQVGRSYEFPIEECKYRNLADNQYDKVLAKANDKNCAFPERVRCLAWILQYTDFYPINEPYSIFSPKHRENQLPQCFEECKDIADGLVAEVERAKDQVCLEDMAIYSATLAQLYGQVYDYDSEIANTYLSEAASAYRQVETKSDDLKDQAYLFYCATALYRYTGQSGYHAIIKDYLDANNNRRLFSKTATATEMLADEAHLFGLVEYLNTTYSVDVDQCETAMKSIMRMAEDFENIIQAKDYRDYDTDIDKQLLTDWMCVIAVAEHVIVSREYNNLLKDGIHSLFGQYDYIDATDELDDFLTDGSYFYLLGQIAEGDYKEKESIKSESIIEESEEQ